MAKTEVSLHLQLSEEVARSTEYTEYIGFYLWSWLLQLLALLCDPYRRVYFKCKIDHEYCVADIN